MALASRPLAIPKNRPLVVCGTSIASGGGSVCVAKQFPLWGKGDPTYFWAHEGLVWYEDSREDIPEHRRFGHMTARDALQRCSAVSDMLFKSSEDNRWAHERKVAQQFICEMEEVCRAAMDHGNPMDNIDFLADRRRRKPKTSIMPQIVNLDI